MSGETVKVQVHEIRKCATCVYLACEEPVANDIARILNGAADTIEALTQESTGGERP